MELRVLEERRGWCSEQELQMELQKEPQALHLQAVTFSIHRGAAQPDLAGANPAQPVPNMSPAAGSSDTELLLNLPSAALLRDSSRSSAARALLRGASAWRDCGERPRGENPGKLRIPER